MKPTDYSKIEKIRAAAMEIISRQGIVNSSVASIAAQAGVSAGYLYRHYQSKDALIEDLFSSKFVIINDKISLLIEQKCGIGQIIREIVMTILNLAERDPSELKFITMMLNDFSMIVNADIRNDLQALIEEIMALAKKDKKIRKDVRIEDIYLAMIILPMQYLSVRAQIMDVSNETLPLDAEHIIDMALRMVAGGKKIVMAK